MYPLKTLQSFAAPKANLQKAATTTEHCRSQRSDAQCFQSILESFRVHWCARELNGALKPDLEHGNPSNLRRYCHTNPRAASYATKPAQGIPGSCDSPRIQQECADHGAASSLASLAVDNRYILLVCLQPGLHISAEIQHVGEIRWAVISGGKSLRLPGETIVSKVSFGTEVVNAEVAAMGTFEEALHLAVRIPKTCTRASAREAHGNKTGRDVGQVQVEAVFHKAMPASGDSASYPAAHPRLQQGRRAHVPVAFPGESSKPRLLQQVTVFHRGAFMG
mmetsp:Transcript_53204/g.127233  ORF Transcript_53204/g.127233 Transcript_53204/m.127233 type:complete len:278 (+) Transcript_53204:509-1342(+)